MGNNLDIKSVLGLKVDGLADVTKLSDAMKSYDINLANVSKSSVKLGKDGQVVKVTVVEQTNAFTRLISTLKLTESGYVRLSTATERNIDAQNRYLAMVKRNSDAAVAAAEQESLRIIAARRRTADANGRDAERQVRDAAKAQAKINQQVAFTRNSQAALQALQGQFGPGKIGQNLGATQSILGSAGKNPLAFQQALSAFQGGNAQVLVGQAGKIQAALTRLGNAGTQSGNSMTKAWSTFVGVFSSQILFRTVSTLINQFNTSIKDAAAFENQIAGILTISQRTSLGFDNTRISLRKLSDQFGTTLEDNASGAYEAISNQVVKGADAFLFLEKASNFAQASMSKTSDSVDLLSSVLNSYSLTADKTDRISSILFKTIDLGRVKANDLAQTYGRLLPTARAVGVSFEEVSAAVATLTVQGIKPADSLTLINNLLVSLLKPTDAMKKFFKELGVSSGEAAIRTFGFAGFLKILDGEALKGSTRLAELTSNIRSIRAELGLTGESFKVYQKNLQIITTGQNDFNKAVEITGNNSGKEFDRLSQRLKNIFVVDFGKPFLDGLLRINSAIGGIDNSLQFLGRSARFAVSIPLTAVGLAQQLTGRKATVGLVAEMERQAELSIENSGNVAEAVFRANADAYAQFSITRIDAAQELFTKNLQKQTQSQLQIIADGRAQASRIVAGEQRFQDQQNIGAAGDLFFRQYENRVRKYQDLANKSKGLADQAKVQIRQAPAELQTKFEGLREAVPINSQIDRARELIRLRISLASGLKSASAATTADVADKEFSNLEKITERLVRLRTESARVTGSGVITPKQEERRLEAELVKLNTVRLSTLEKIAALQDKNTAAARQQVVTEQNRLKAIQDSFKTLSEFKLETPTGDRKFKTAAEASAEFERRRAELFKLLDAGPQKNLQDMIQQFGLFVTLEQRKASIIKQIKAQQQEEELTNQEKTIASSAKSAIAARDQITQGQKAALQEVLEQTAFAVNNLGRLQAGTKRGTPDDFKIKAALKELEAFGKNRDINLISGAFNRLKTASPSPNITQTLEALNRAREALKVLNTQNELAAKTDAAIARLATGINTVGSATVQTSVSLQNLGVTTNGVFSSAGQTIEFVIQRLIELEKQARTTAKAIEASTLIGGGNGGAGEFHNGGLVGYYAAGGIFRSRGTDTRPAMLTPGEFVVPVGPSRKFRSQLMAMTAGRTPSYFAKGGPVTNIGDVNITVQGGSSDEQSARNIANAVRRQIRIGAVRNF